MNYAKVLDEIMGVLMFHGCVSGKYGYILVEIREALQNFVKDNNLCEKKSSNDSSS